MRFLLKVLAVSLSLSALTVPHLSAQPPVDPPPRVEIQDAFVVGSDLGVTLNWSNDVMPPPAGVRLKLLDSQGANAGAVNFVPLLGSQTVWIPGGALPRASSEAWPLKRQLVLVDPPTREILIEKGVSVFYNGPVLILAPFPGILSTPGRVCTLNVISLECHDSEDKNGDEVSLEIGTGAWYHDPVDSGTKWYFNWPIALCDTCMDSYQTISMDLWDWDDPLFFDPNDHLGSHSENSCSPADKTVTFQGENYTYWLRYVITCYEVTCP